MLIDICYYYFAFFISFLYMKAEFKAGSSCNSVELQQGKKIFLGIFDDNNINVYHESLCYLHTFILYYYT